MPGPVPFHLPLQSLYMSSSETIFTRDNGPGGRGLAAVAPSGGLRRDAAHEEARPAGPDGGKTVGRGEEEGRVWNVGTGQFLWLGITS